jgi:hypothetical protein
MEFYEYEIAFSISFALGVYHLLLLPYLLDFFKAKFFENVANASIVVGLLCFIFCNVMSLFYLYEVLVYGIQ